VFFVIFAVEKYFYGSAIEIRRLNAVALGYFGKAGIFPLFL
jgi:hypothetical protein